MKLVDFPVVDCSTYHITREDNNLLEANSNNDVESRNDHPVTVLRYYHGFLVSSWAWDPGAGAEPEERKVIEKDLLRLGYSPALLNLLRIAGKQGAKWLCLDRDGEKYDDLPVYEW